MNGFGTAAAHGLSRSRPAHDGEDGRERQDACEIGGHLVICDADTGYDEAINVQRTVREYEDRREALWPK